MKVLPKIYIIGAGLSGAVLARLFAAKAYQVKIYEMKSHLGGNCYDYINKQGIMIQKHGPHIFHTDKLFIFNFLKRFTKFNTNSTNVLVNVKNKLIDLPINFQSIDVFFPKTANEIKKIISLEWSNVKAIRIDKLIKSKHASIKQWANFIYKNVYENYSAKMWGIPINKLDRNVLERVQVILGYQNNYFLNDKYQGIPCGGFTKLIKNMLVHKNIELIHHKPQIQFINKTVFIDQQPISGHIFYCGQIDELFNFKYGVIPYRSLNIKFMTKKINSFQSAAIINYPAHKTMTRISEYKKINRQTTPNVTTISREYPGQYNRKSKVFGTPYYPINNSQSLMIYKKYLSHLKQYRNFHLLGRLAEYKYFDMDDAIENAMCKFNSFIEKKMHKN